MLYSTNTENDGEELRDLFKLRIERFRSKKITDLEKSFYLVTSKPNQMSGDAIYTIPEEDMGDVWLDRFKYYGYRVIKCNATEVVHAGSKAKDER
jgi:hypothetical protein